MGKDAIEDRTTKESKYIQQHLANERTYLAWVRTSIAIIGIGFLAANLHFNLNIPISVLGDRIALVIFLFSLSIGLSMIIISTFYYFRKRTDINEQTFRSSHSIILFSTVVSIMIMLLFALYFLFI